MSRLGLALQHIENAFEHPDVPCDPDCPSCVDSCPCRKGYSRKASPDDPCHFCYSVDGPETAPQAVEDPESRQRITEEQIEAMRTLHGLGWSIGAIAGALEVSKSTVWRYLSD